MNQKIKNILLSSPPSFFRRVLERILHPRVSSIQLTLAVSGLLVCFYNTAFWSELWKIAAASQQSWFFLASIFLVLLVFINFCLSLLSFRYFIKPSLIIILFVAAFAAYFMKTYGIMIDRSMIKNILTMDVGNVSELLNVKMLYFVVVLGVLPSLVIVRVEIRHYALVKELFMMLGAVLTSLVIFVVVLISFYKDYISLGNNYNYLRHLINPVNSIYAVVSFVKKTVTSGNVVVRPIGEDARLETVGREQSKKRLVILVVGEAARARNFSLNGYGKKTNPLLEKEDILNFTNTWSCGTVSTLSLPCMFSHFGQEAYSDAKAERHEGLLDVLKRAGVQVLWRENNSGCRGVCDRVEIQMPGRQESGARGRSPGEDGLCVDGECQDMVLLSGLQSYIDHIESDAFIVLHQKGSYGPAYYRRSPPAFKAFLPECTTNQLQECRTDELVNAYDNTILYTDYFLAQVIDLLKKNGEQFEGAMLYLSDSGESLGEKNIYLHGVPYMIAPDEQKHVPFILWMGEAFAAGSRLDKECLRKKIDAPLSHDNLFHSALGMMRVKTAMYNKELDIFAGCRQ